MAQSGRRPMPVDIKALLGDKPLAMLEQGRLVPEAKEGQMQPTQRFALNQNAMRYFEFYKQNVGFGHLKPLDAPLVEKLCYCQVMFDQVVEEYVESNVNLVGTTAGGSETLSPYFQMFTKLADMIRRFSAELSFTPSERARIKMASGSADEKDPKQVHNANMREKYGLGGAREP